MVASHDLHLLTGSYALDALPADEQADFEKHLSRCAACAEEVRGLRETTARLGVAGAPARGGEGAARRPAAGDAGAGARRRAADPAAATRQPRGHPLAGPAR